MKTFKILCAFLVFATFSACHDDDDDNPAVPAVDIPQHEMLEGGWYLINVSGSITGSSHDFPQGEIIWTFNANNTVSIFNTNDDTNAEDFFETGEYDYAIVANPATPELCAENIVVGGTSFGCFTFEGNQLKFSQVESDGYMLTFVKTPPLVINDNK